MVHLKMDLGTDTLLQIFSKGNIMSNKVLPRWIRDPGNATNTLIKGLFITKHGKGSLGSMNTGRST